MVALLAFLSTIKNKRIMKYDLEKLREIYGNVKELVVPSGFKVVLREQNGEDDSILSNALGVKEGTATDSFISGIVVATDYTDNGKLSSDVAATMKLCDKYFIMIASRIFSLGQTFNFTYPWEGKDGIEEEVEYEEDLGLYIWDYSKPFPKEGDPDFYKYRIKPHTHGKDSTREITLSSGKKVRYHFIDSIGENYQMNQSEDNTSINSELLARRIELNVNNRWVEVENFKNFSSKDMSEIRYDVENNDNLLNLFSDIQHPKDKRIVKFPILSSSDFFFPRVI